MILEKPLLTVSHRWRHRISMKNSIHSGLAASPIRPPLQARQLTTVPGTKVHPMRWNGLFPSQSAVQLQNQVLLRKPLGGGWTAE